MLTVEFGATPARCFAAACWRTTGGNPLFLRELLRRLRAEGIAPEACAAALVEQLGPLAVSRHVQGRLVRQPLPVRRLAEAVSVLGPQTPLPLAAELAGLSRQQAEDAADRLVVLGILEWSTELSFTHPLLAAAVYEGLSAGSRTRAHEHAAAVLARAGAAPEREAAHHLKAPPAGDMRRLQVLLAAADQARRRGAPESAATFLGRALAEPPPAELRSEIARQLGNCEAYTVQFPAADRHLREAVTLALTPHQRALAGASLGRFLQASGRPTEAVDAMRVAVNQLPVGDAPGLRMRCEAELAGYARLVLDDRNLLLAHLRSQVLCFPTDWAPLPYVLRAHEAFELAAVGHQSAEVSAAAEDALRGGHLAPDRSALYVAAHALLCADGLGAVTGHLERALDLARSRGLVVAVSLCRAHLALAALWRGDLPEVRFQLDLAREAVDVADHATPLLTACTVELELERGDLAAAAEASAHCELGEQAAASSLGLGLLLARGRLRLARGDPTGALAAFGHVGELHQRWGAKLLDYPWRCDATRALLALGDRAGAQQLAAENLALARSVGAPRPLGHALRTCALVADGPDGLRLARDAVEVLAPSAARLELAHAHATLGRLLLDAGHRATGREQLRSGLELALDCGALGLVTAVRAGLAAAGGRPPRLRTTGLAALTPAERRVARLAAKDMTNREIAKELYITEKTVEGHLSRVFRKVGARVRSELPRLLHDGAVAG